MNAAERIIAACATLPRPTLRRQPLCMQPGFCLAGAPGRHCRERYAWLVHCRSPGLPAYRPRRAVLARAVVYRLTAYAGRTRQPGHYFKGSRRCGIVPSLYLMPACGRCLALPLVYRNHNATQGAQDAGLYRFCCRVYRLPGQPPTHRIFFACRGYVPRFLRARLGTTVNALGCAVLQQQTPAYHYSPPRS